MGMWTAVRSIADRMEGVGEEQCDICHFVICHVGVFTLHFDECDMLLFGGGGFGYL